MAQFVCNYISKVLGRAVTVNVIVPSPAFGENGRPYIPGAPYPVVYLLAGDGCDENTWMRYTSIERYAEENNIAVVLCPVENTAGLEQTVYIPFGSTQPETDPASPFIDIRTISFPEFITEELVDFIAGYLPVSRRRKDMYLAGQDEAAYTALLLGLQKDRYAAIGAFGYHASNDAALHEAIAEYTPAAGREAPALFLTARSEEDAGVLQKNLRDAQIGYQYQTMETGGWGDFDRTIEAFIEQLPRSDLYHTTMPKRKL